MDNSKKIFVIDDNSENLNYLSEILKTEGYEVFPANSGELALKFLKKNTPNLILLDIKMSGMDGFEVCKRIKQNDRLKNIPIIFLSVLNETKDIVNGFKLGAVDYITKPFFKEELLARVNTHITLQNKEDELNKKIIELQSVEDELRASIEEYQQINEKLKTTKKYVEEKEKYFRSLLNNLNDDIVVINENYEITDINNSFLATSGHSRNEAIGKKCYKVSYNIEKPCAEIGKKCDLKKVFETGKTFYRQDKRIKKDGSEVWVDILLSPFKNTDGSITHVIESARDVTELKKIKAELEYSNIINKLIIDSAPIGITIFNSKGDCLMTNDAIGNIIGVTKEQILQQNFHHIKSWKKSGLLKVAIKALNEKKTKHFDLKFTTTYKKTIYLDCLLTPAIQNNSQYLIVIIKDVSEQKEAEKALKSTSLILNRSHVVAFTWKNNKNWSIEYVSDNVEKLLEYSAEELMSGEIEYADCILKDDFKEVEKEMKKYSENINCNDFSHKPYRIVTKSGKIKIVKDWTYFERNEDGEITNFRGIITDITQRKKAEDEIKKLSIAVEQSPSVIAIATQQGKLEYVNSKFCELTGYTNEEIIGQKPSILKSGKTDNTIYKNLWETILSGKVWRGELINKKKNGELFWEAASISPILNQKGGITNFIKIAEDITERKKLEEKINNHNIKLEELVKTRTQQLWYNEKKFKAIFEQVALGVVILDMNTNKYLQVNQRFCDIIGYSLDETLNLTYIDITHPDDLFRDEENIEKLKKGEVSEFSIDKRYVRKNKEIIWVNISVSVLTRTEKEAYSFVFVKDITEDKLSKERLREAFEKEKEINLLKINFISKTSHEFRTPLATISFATEFIKKYKQRLSEEKINEKLDKITTQTKYMTELLNNFLFVEKIKAGKINYTPEQINISKYIKENVQDFIETNQKFDIIIKDSSTNDEILFDKKIGKSIFQNLISNSIKYSDKIDKIDMYLYNAEQSFIVKIQDYGIGIPKENQERIFEPFVRADNANIHQGTGLGLSIVKSGIEAHSGSIYFESELNKGTTFWLKFPLLKKNNM